MHYLFGSSGISVEKNSRFAQSEPKTPLQMRHPTSSTKGAPIGVWHSCGALVPLFPPTAGGAGAAAPGDFAHSGCHTTRPICVFSLPVGALRFSLLGKSVIFPTEIPEEAFILFLLVVPCVSKDIGTIWRCLWGSKRLPSRIRILNKLLRLSSHKISSLLFCTNFARLHKHRSPDQR